MRTWKPNTRKSVAESKVRLCLVISFQILLFASFLFFQKIIEQWLSLRFGLEMEFSKLANGNSYFHIGVHTLWFSKGHKQIVQCIQYLTFFLAYISVMKKNGMLNKSNLYQGLTETPSGPRAKALSGPPSQDYRHLSWYTGKWADEFKM